MFDRVRLLLLLTARHERELERASSHNVLCSSLCARSRWTAECARQPVRATRLILETALTNALERLLIERAVCLSVRRLRL